MIEQASAWLAALRPRQWVKNVLVFAAPAGAGVLDVRHEQLEALAAFACFCITASGTYLLNDVRDVEVDRRHPTKRRRPIAAGRVDPRAATVVGITLLAAGVSAGFAVRPALGVTLATYTAVTLAYSLVLRNLAVLDLLGIASGFVLRAVAGAAATDVPMSDWFLIVTCFGSLFMAVGKRTGEANELGDDELAASIRPTLAVYSPEYLAYLRAVASGVMFVAYCLWAFETAETSTNDGILFELSIVPFVAAVLRYALLIDQGEGAAPEQLVLQDRVLQAMGFCWAVVYGAGVYAS